MCSKFGKDSKDFGSPLKRISRISIRESFTGWHLGLDITVHSTVLSSTPPLYIVLYLEVQTTFHTVQFNNTKLLMYYKQHKFNVHTP